MEILNVISLHGILIREKCEDLKSINNTDKVDNIASLQNQQEEYRKKTVQQSSEEIVQLFFSNQVTEICRDVLQNLYIVYFSNKCL